MNKLRAMEMNKQEEVTMSFATLNMRKVFVALAIIGMVIFSIKALVDGYEQKKMVSNSEYVVVEVQYGDTLVELIKEYNAGLDHEDIMYLATNILYADANDAFKNFHSHQGKIMLRAGYEVAIPVVKK